MGDSCEIFGSKRRIATLFRSSPGLVGLICLTSLWMACGRADDAARPAATPRPTAPRPSIVSLTPLATRFVIALGAGPQLVGVDPESGQLPGLGDLPGVGLAGAAVLEPDLVLVAAGIADARVPGYAELVRLGASIHEFSPHDLEEVFALSRELGPQIVGEDRGQRFEVGISRPLAEIGGSSFGQPRPRVLGVVGLDPVVLAGGHSFETDLIEIAGGQSVTHGGAETRIALGSSPWTQFDPDLLLVMLPREPSADELGAALGELPPGLVTRIFRVEAETFWLEADQASAHRLRELIESIR